MQQNAAVNPLNGWASAGLQAVEYNDRGKSSTGEFKNRSHNSKAAGKPKKLSEISSEQEERLKTNISELDRVLGGGP